MSQPGLAAFLNHLPPHHHSHAQLRCMRSRWWSRWNWSGRENTCGCCSAFFTSPKFNIAPEKWWEWKTSLSFWGPAYFLGAMLLLNFRGCFCHPTVKTAISGCLRKGKPLVASGSSMGFQKPSRRWWKIQEIPAAIREGWKWPSRSVCVFYTTKSLKNDDSEIRRSRAEGTVVYLPLFIGSYTSQVVQDFWTINSIIFPWNMRNKDDHWIHVHPNGPGAE